MITESVAINTGRGRSLAGRIHRPGTAAAAGVIFSHGLFSTKDGYKITRLRDDIVSAGFILMTFDFTGAGESPGHISDLSLLQEVEDLASAVNTLENRGVERIHLMGSSMGAAVTLLYASRRNPRIGSLMLIATPVDIEGLIFSAAGISDIEALPVDGTTTVQNIPLKNTFFHEIKKIRMIEAVRNISVPVLAIHGGCDAVVDPSNIILLKENLQAGLNSVIIPDGDHNLTRDSDIRAIRDAVIPWLAGTS